MADEVYQENIWKEGAKFTSFRKVAFDMNAFEGTWVFKIFILKAHVLISRYAIQEDHHFSLFPFTAPLKVS